MMVMIGWEYFFFSREGGSATWPSVEYLEEGTLRDVQVATSDL
jgi:hypothetical protein